MSKNIWLDKYLLQYGIVFFMTCPIFFSCIPADGWIYDSFSLLYFIIIGFVYRKRYNKIFINYGFALFLLLFFIYIFYNIIGQSFASWLYPKLFMIINELFLFQLIYNAAINQDFDIVKLKKTLFLFCLCFILPLDFLSLYKFMRLLHGEQFSILVSPGNGQYPLGTSLRQDYNVFAMGIILSNLLILDYVFSIRRPYRFKTLGYLSFFISFIVIILSGSRRGLIIFTVIFLVVFLKTIIGVLQFQKEAARLILVTISFVFIGWFVYQTEFTKEEYKDNSSLEHIFNRLSTIEDINNNDTHSPAYERLIRIQFAQRIIDSRPLYQNIFGDAFDYHHKFYAKTSNHLSKFEYDYPHNFFISQFLYSGIIGFILLLVLLIYTLILYVKFGSMLRIYLFMYIICVFFLSTSGDVLFNDINLIFLTLLPIFYSNIKNIDKPVKRKIF